MEEQERDLHAEVAQIFMDAGWRPNWKTSDPRVLTYSQDCGASWNIGGISPRGLMEWANTALDPATSSDPVDAARRLVAMVGAPEPEASFEIPPAVRAVMIQNGNGDHALAQEPQQVETPTLDDPAALLGSGGEVGTLDGSEEQADGAVEDVDPIDADFTIEDLGGPEELTAEDHDAILRLGSDPEDFTYDEIKPHEEGSGAFIFGDNLDQIRTAAIGRVIRYANALMPHWAIEDDARLAYLRNFAMGVSEKRWDDDPALSAELNALETTIRRINEIKNARDAKVEFLEAASREEIEDFAVERDWP